MKVLLYNIAYGSGTAGGLARRIMSAHHYIRRPEKKFQDICRFIQAQNPDITGLLEIDGGSSRTKSGSQIKQMAGLLGHYSYGCVKYPENSRGRKLPIFKHQQNALFLRENHPQSRFHFLHSGFKRLVIESEYKGIKIFLVHLSIRPKTRCCQLEELRDLVRVQAAPGQPCLLMGDFNTFGGAHELEHLRNELELESANIEGLPTFPALKEKRQLDYILYSSGLRLKSFEIAKYAYSDHLPLIAEFA